MALQTAVLILGVALSVFALLVVVCVAEDNPEGERSDNRRSSDRPTPRPTILSRGDDDWRNRDTYNAGRNYRQ